MNAILLESRRAQISNTAFIPIPQGFMKYWIFKYHRSFILQCASVKQSHD